MFKLRLKHYYEWLRASLSPQAQTNQISTDHIRIQKSAKRPSSSLLYPVSPAQTCNRKSTKHRVSWFLQSPVSSPKATSKMETSHRLKQAKSIPEDRKIQGDPRINKNILEYRGMGDVNRPTRRLSVSPVIIPALTTIVDRQFKQDRSLCPVRALRYYLDRTKDLRGDRSLLFISVKKGHSSDQLPCLHGLNRQFYRVINKQISKPWTWSKSKLTISEPLQPLKPFMVRFR